MSTKKITLRPYQQKLLQDVYAAWHSGHKNVLAVLPTGGGKTVLFTEILAAHAGYSCAIAHRRELVGQMSLTLNKRQIPHFAHVQSKDVKWLVSLHMAEHGVSYYRTGARCAVASVDTLRSRENHLAAWCKRVGLWIMDEGHHVIEKNKWGKAVRMFPNARGLSVTATPERADGKGLARSADGVIDTMVIGPTGRELIEQGYLTDYIIYSPPSDIDMSDVPISSTGDYSQPKMVTKVKQSKVIGDVVEHYLRIAPGKLGITFVPSIEIAQDMAAAFNKAGVPAEAVSSKTPRDQRNNATRKLRNGDLKQLVNVDIFGEGFDLPAIEVVSMARPTESYPLLSQQFGRALRPMQGKAKAIIIDHVGNCMRLFSRYGLPDSDIQWNLMSREKRSNTTNIDGPPLRMCTECTGVFQSYQRICPYCQHTIIPTNRSAPEFIDGDLTILDTEIIRQLYKERARIDTPYKDIETKMRCANAPFPAIAGASKQHRLRQEAQTKLRETLALWGGWQYHMGRGKSESWQRFYRKYGVDVLSAQILGRPEAEALTERIVKDLQSAGVMYE